MSISGKMGAATLLVIVVSMIMFLVALSMSFDTSLKWHKTLEMYKVYETDCRQQYLEIESKHYQLYHKVKEQRNRSMHIADILLKTYFILTSSSILLWVFVWNKESDAMEWTLASDVIASVATLVYYFTFWVINTGGFIESGGFLPTFMMGETTTYRFDRPNIAVQLTFLILFLILNAFIVYTWRRLSTDHTFAFATKLAVAGFPIAFVLVGSLLLVHCFKTTRAMRTCVEDYETYRLKIAKALVALWADPNVSDNVKNGLVREIESNYRRYHAFAVHEAVKFNSVADGLQWYVYVMNKKGQEFKDVEGVPDLSNVHLQDIHICMRQNRQNLEPERAIRSYSRWVTAFFTVFLTAVTYVGFNVVYAQYSKRKFGILILLMVLLFAVFMCIWSWIQAVTRAVPTVQ